MKTYPRYLDGLRYVCALFLYFYGISKLAGHQLTVPPDMVHKPIGSLSGYWLTWFYYSYSPVYRDMLGAMQVIGASLLLFRRSTLLAALTMTPIMANIMLINIFYSIAVGAEIMAAFILGCMLLILWHQRATLSDVFWTSQPAESRSTRQLHWLLRALVLLVVLVQAIIGTLMAH